MFTTSATLSAAERHTAIENMFAQVLPLGDERHRESAVWFAFSVAAQAQSELQPLIHDFYYGLRTLVADVLAEGQRAGLLAEEIDIPIETERLASLITGLNIGAVLHPEPMSPDTMLSVLRRHLDSLSVPPADGHSSRKAGEEPAR